jgi:DDE superfamily endonuclease
MTIIFSSQPFYNRHVQHSSANDPVSSRIYDNGKLWPFFQGCLGAINGSHIHISPPAALHSLYQNQKGFLLQNCLFICNFNMLFTYILSGWKGSATDAQVWADALARGFSMPEGFYYLTDAGYPHCKELLVPYAPLPSDVDNDHDSGFVTIFTFIFYFTFTFSLSPLFIT